MRPIGATGELEPLYREAVACLESGLHVLVLGESGVGKTRIAMRLAEARRGGPVVRATLGTSDDLNTIRSELFGHERGAFSGATDVRRGFVSQADGGTLVLDEVLNLSASAQHLLLDLTQFGTYRPLGHRGADPLRANFWLIAATNGDLEAAVAEGRFRGDLYHRLAGMVLRVAPLRERRAEIPALAAAILARELDAPMSITDGAIARLADESNAWPGNVRQLETVVRRARVRAREDGAARVDVVHLDVPLGDPWRSELGRSAVSRGDAASESRASREADALSEVLGERERLVSLERRRAILDREEAAILRSSLQRWGWVLSRAANELGIARTSLISRMKVLDVPRWPDER